MTRVRSYLIGLFLGLLSLFAFGVNATSASEGTVELRSTGSEPYRCYAVSIGMLIPEYRVLLTCKFILYPAEADTDIFNYVVWATPTEGTKPLKLGLIGQGRAEFKTKSRFVNPFVTTEPNKDIKSPTGRVVMRGNLEPIAFLEEVTNFEPITQPTINPKASGMPAISPTGTQINPQSGLTTKEKFVAAFKRAGVAALVAMGALVGLVFVITRSRG